MNRFTKTTMLALTATSMLAAPALARTVSTSLSAVADGPVVELSLDHAASSGTPTQSVRPRHLRVAASQSQQSNIKQKRVLRRQLKPTFSKRKTGARANPGSSNQDRPRARPFFSPTGYVTIDNPL